MTSDDAVTAAAIQVIVPPLLENVDITTTTICSAAKAVHVFLSELERLKQAQASEGSTP